MADINIGVLSGMDTDVDALQQEVQDALDHFIGDGMIGGFDTTTATATVDHTKLGEWLKQGFSIH